jgi:hypothetical protein
MTAPIAAAPHNGVKSLVEGFIVVSLRKNEKPAAKIGARGAEGGAAPRKIEGGISAKA